MTNSLDQAINELSFITCAVCQAKISPADNFCQGCGASQYRARQPGALNQLAPFVPGNLMVLTCSSCGSHQVKEPQPCTCCGQNIIGKFELTSVARSGQSHHGGAVEPPYVKITQTVKTTDVSLGSKHLGKLNLQNVIGAESHVVLPEVSHEKIVEPVVPEAITPAIVVEPAAAVEIVGNAAPAETGAMPVEVTSPLEVTPVAEKESQSPSLGSPILGRGLHSFAYGTKSLDPRGTAKLKESFSISYLGRAVIALAIIAFYIASMWLLAHGGKYTSAALRALTKNLQSAPKLRVSNDTAAGGSKPAVPVEVIGAHSTLPPAQKQDAVSKPAVNQGQSISGNQPISQMPVSRQPAQQAVTGASQVPPPPPLIYSSGFSQNAQVPLAQTKTRKFVAKQTWDVHGDSQSLNADGAGDANARSAAQQTLEIQDEQSQFASPVKQNRNTEPPLKSVEEPVRPVQNPVKPQSTQGTWKIEYANEPPGSAKLRGGRLASVGAKAEKVPTNSADMSCYNKFLSQYFSKLKEAEPTDTSGEVEPPSFDEWLKLGKPKF